MTHILYIYIQENRMLSWTVVHDIVILSVKRQNMGKLHPVWALLRRHIMTPIYRTNSRIQALDAYKRFKLSTKFCQPVMRILMELSSNLQTNSWLLVRACLFTDRKHEVPCGLRLQQVSMTSQGKITSKSDTNSPSSSTTLSIYDRYRFERDFKWNIILIF